MILNKELKLRYLWYLLGVVTGTGIGIAAEMMRLGVSW